ncbi:hypothetical protein V6255_11995 [Psychromonas arctica]|uniref:Uncharacterized protein n=1 Tax=Psychromonas arctica TaxID=168275 RepID=A0ABU9HDC6_9GAMM
MQNINTYIKENIKSVSVKNVFVAPEIPEKKLNNAAKSFDLTDNFNSIIAIFDNTVFGSAKDGIVFTGEKAVYKTSFSDPIDLIYSEFESVNHIEKVIVNDNGKNKTDEFISIKLKCGKEIKVDALLDCKYKKLAEVFNTAYSDFDEYEEEDQIISLSEMPEILKIAYVKVIINMAFSDDGEVDEKEFSEILLLMTRLDFTTESRYELRNYIATEENQIPLSELLSSIDNECIPSHNKAIRISLIKDLISTYMSVNGGSYENFEFLEENKSLFGVSKEEIELAIMAIKNDFNMLRDDFSDDALKKGMKELTAKAGAVGVPLAAVYLSGSVVGMSAAGLTSGLATLGLGGALGFSSMATGIGVAVLVGLGAYKGIMHLTGANELDKMKRRELMLNEVIKQTQSTLSLLIGDLNFISVKINDAMKNHSVQDATIKKLMQRMSALTAVATVLNKKSGTMQNSSIKLRCPTFLDTVKLKSLTSEPVKKPLYGIVLSYYQEETIEKSKNGTLVKEKVLKIKQGVPTVELEKLASIFEAVGYFKATDVIKGKLTGLFS